MGDRPEREVLDTRMAKAMSHPVRVRALAILEDREASPSEIARELGVPVVNVSHHIQVLLKLGRIEQVEVRHKAGALEHRYRIVREPIALPEDLELMAEEGARSIAAHVARTAFGDLRDAIQASGFRERPDIHLTWTPLELDEQGWRTIYELLAQTLERAIAEEAAAKERLAAGETGGPRVRSRLSLFHYEAPRAGDADAGDSSAEA